MGGGASDFAASGKETTSGQEAALVGEVSHMHSILGCAFIDKKRGFGVETEFHTNVKRKYRSTLLISQPSANLSTLQV